MVTMSDTQDHPVDESTSAQPQHVDVDAPGETDAPNAPDGQFHDQEMPTTDGELSRPDPDAGLADRET